MEKVSISSNRIGHRGNASSGVLRMVVLAGLTLLGGWARAESSLDDITYNSLPGDRVQVRLRMSSPPSQDPLSFTIDNPARIALDLPGTRLAMTNKSRNIGVGVAQSVSAVEAGGRSRVVLNLARLVPYTVGREGNDVVVSLGGDAGSTQPRPAEYSPAPPPAPVAMLPPPARRGGYAPIRGGGGNTIQDVDFRRGDRGQALIVLRLGNSRMSSDVREEGGKLVVDFPGASVPDRLNRRLDVSDFATPVKEVDTRRSGKGARVTITPSGNYEHMAYQTDETLTVEVKPMTAEEKAAKKDKVYTGERLSLNFQNIEVRAVLQLLADFTGLNMVAADTVAGNVTLRLKNVPWDQAMDIILKAKGLGMRQNGNVVMVAPQEEIAAREKLELESQKQIQELAPLRTEYVQVNYGKAADMANLIKAEKNNLLSERGNVSVDERTNTLLVQDTADKLAEIRAMVTQLDVAVRQVLIESRIVIADDSFTRDLGVKFGFAKRSGSNSDPGFTIGGKRPGDTVFSGVRNNPVTGAREQANIQTGFDTGGGNEGYVVDLPIGAPAGSLGLAIGVIGSYLLQLELQAAEAENRGEVISSPQVITANQKEAVIETGEEIPYQQASSSGATNVAFKKAVLSLRVTPQITPDDRIILDLKVNKDTVGARQVLGVPSIDTRQVSTQVLVDNGQTVVLGGVYEQTNRNNVRRVPFLGEVPYFGNLFRTKSLRNDKNELLIFVTPKVVKDSLTLKR